MCILSFNAVVAKWLFSYFVSLPIVILREKYNQKECVENGFFP